MEPEEELVNQPYFVCNVFSTPVLDVLLGNSAMRLEEVLLHFGSNVQHANFHDVDNSEYIHKNPSATMFPCDRGIYCTL